VSLTDNFSPLLLAEYASHYYKTDEYVIRGARRRIRR
jgi:hypothetical protein